ncbi:hypothetical protein RSK20926_00952, partial [Roseobacter sp. SK209-2-6]
MSGPSLTALPLPGVFHYQPQLHEDNRGSFGPSLLRKMLDEAGLNSTWV